MDITGKGKIPQLIKEVVVKAAVAMKVIDIFIGEVDIFEIFKSLFNPQLIRKRLFSGNSLKKNSKTASSCIPLS